ncbi:MAG: LLM class flavin-dependent oxidoreductase [Acidimicrobiales bacterium]
MVIVFTLWQRHAQAGRADLVALALDLSETDPMKIRIGYGLGTQNNGGGPEAFAALVDGLERHGFDSLWLSERIGGSAVDPLVGLAVAAGRTTKLKLGTSVLVLPGRNPALLAKELASLDLLSKGRFLPSVGLGIAHDLEQQAFAVSRADRAGWFDEALPLIRRFWAGEAVDHDGPRFHYRGLIVLPRPLQSPMDVWMGGRAPAELKRVGRLGDGWLGSFCTPESVRPARHLIEATAAEHGRSIDPEHFGTIIPYAMAAGIPEAVIGSIRARQPDAKLERMVPGSISALKALIEDYVAAGFSKFVLSPLSAPLDWDDELSELAEVLLPLQRVAA